MIHEKINLANNKADGYVIPFGGFNMVFARTKNGMIGCGMFDVAALDRFNYPAARIGPSSGNSISSLEDLLTGIAKDVNKAAVERGITIGMSGKEALEKF